MLSGQVSLSPNYETWWVIFLIKTMRTKWRSKYTMYSLKYLILYASLNWAAKFTLCNPVDYIWSDGVNLNRHQSMYCLSILNKGNSSWTMVVTFNDTQYDKYLLHSIFCHSVPSVCLLDNERAPSMFIIKWDFFLHGPCNYMQGGCTETISRHKYWNIIY